MNNKIINELEDLFGEVTCPLNYNKDYELLIAVMLSAQTTDVTVNKVTVNLFSKYDIFSLVDEDKKTIENIIRPCGTMKRKSEYIIGIAKLLVRDYNGQVPNDQAYLESLPGVGHKTANVIRSELFNEQTLAVDTHIFRVAKRLGMANKDDDIITVENKLMEYFKDTDFRKVHLLLLMFGRKICKSINPKCLNCPFKSQCQK